MKRSTLVISALVISFASSATFAAPKQKVSGVYFGGSLGFSKGITIDSEKNRNDEYEKTSTSAESSFQLLGGYQFNRVVGIEIDYLDFGEYGELSDTLSVQSIAAQANVGYTFHMGLRPFALIGLSSVNLDKDTDLYKEDTYLGLRFGGGLEYAPASIGGWAVRVAYSVDYFEAESILNKEYNNLFTNMSLGLNYKF